MCRPRIQFSGPKSSTRRLSSEFYITIASGVYVPGTQLSNIAQASGLWVGYKTSGTSAKLKDEEMFKGLLSALTMLSLFAVAPASAQMAMDCTEANMTKMSADMDKMPVGEKKTMAMKEMGMAKEMMAKKDMAGCKSSMDKMSSMMK